MSQLYVAQVPQMSTAQKIITALVAIGVIVAIIWGLSNLKGKKGKGKGTKTGQSSAISPQLPDDNPVIASDISDIFRSITGVNTDGVIDVDERVTTADPMAWIRGNKNQVTPPEDVPEILPVVPEPIKKVDEKKVIAQPVDNISLGDLYETEIITTDGIPLLPA